MKYDGYIFQNGIVVKLLDIFAANQHFAFLHIIEPGNQFNHSAFTGTRSAHKSHALAITDFEIDTMQHIGFSVIRKSNIPKLNIMVFGEICSTLINRNIQYLFGFGDSV